MSRLDEFMKSAEEFAESFPDVDKAIYDFNTLVGISREILDEEIVKHPARFAWVAVQAENAKAHEARMKRIWEKERETTDLGIRSGDIEVPEELKGGRGGKLTEKAIESLVNLDADVEKAYENYIQARHQANKMVKLVEAMTQKADMLRTYASNHRKERESDFMTLKKNADEVVKANNKQKTGGGQ